MSTASDVREHPLLWWGTAVAFCLIPICALCVTSSLAFYLSPVPLSLENPFWKNPVILGWLLTGGLAGTVVALIVAAGIWNWLFGTWFDRNERAHYETLTNDATVLPHDVWEDNA